MKLQLRAVVFLFFIFLPNLAGAQEGASLGGVGISLTLRKKEGFLKVQSLLENSPEWKAGVKPKDRIVAIDGASVEKKSLAEIHQMFAGKVGSSINLSLLRDGWEKPKTFLLVRRTVAPVHVEAKVIKGSSVGFLRILDFLDTANADVEKILRSLLKKRISHLIIDLRGNPGGDLDSVREITSLFLPANQTVFSIKYLNGLSEEETTSKYSTDITNNISIGVLIDHETEGGAEVMAAALKDLKRAALFGETTFGRGKVTQIFSKFPIPTGLIVTPSGKRIQGNGVEPDYKTPIDREKFGFDKTDPLIAEALLRSK